MYLLISLFLISLTISNGKVLRDDLFRLDIVHYNDFHARFEETSVANSVCLSNDKACIGGFARLYYEIQMLLHEKPGSLLLNAGDCFQGTYWYSLLKWNVTQEFMNLLPHDAFAIGNHEFDDGVKGLAPFLASLNAPVLAANMDVSKEPILEGLFKPHIIVERGGKQIGIIGLITTETAYTSSSDGVKFTDPFTAVEREAKKLTDYGVDIIIVLSHCGIDIDKKIAEDHGENVDVIVGGHSHSLLWNGISPSGEHITGPYPVLIKSKNRTGHQVLVVTASAFTKYVGNLSIWFDHRGELKTFDGTPVFLNRSIPEDQYVKQLLKPYTDKLHSVVEEVVGESSVDLLANSCGMGECTLGNVIADSLLEAAKKRHPSNLTQIAFILRNNIRGSILKGPITRGVLINTVPFTNKIEVFNIKGRYLKDIFENCVKKAWSEHPFIGPWMPQVSGLKLVYNTTEQSDQRVKSIHIKEGDEHNPVNNDELYEVITYDFLANGGNEFHMMKEHGHNNVLIGIDAEVLEEYTKTHTPINVALEGRITVLS